MILVETNIVTTENGIAPAGKPDECFWCNAKLGLDHKEDCVCRLKTVRLLYTYEIVIKVPQSWTDYDIEFHRNEGSWCADNGLDDLDTWRDIEESRGYCLCRSFECKFIAEEP